MVKGDLHEMLAKYLNAPIPERHGAENPAPIPSQSPNFDPQAYEIEGAGNDEGTDYVEE